MGKEAFKSYFSILSASEHQVLIEELQQLDEAESQIPEYPEARRKILANKQDFCANFSPIQR